MPDEDERPDPWAPPARRVPLEKPEVRDAAPRGPGAPGPVDAQDGAGAGQVPPPPVAPGGPDAAGAYGYPGHPGGPGYGPGVPPGHGPGPGQGPGHGPGQGYPGYPGYSGYPGYPGAPGYGPPGAWGIAPAPANGMGIASLVLGIVAVTGFCLYGLGIVLGVLAVIFGAIGRGKARRGEADNGGMALAGIILGVVGALVSAAFLVFLVWGAQNGVFDEEESGGDSFDAARFVSVSAQR
ncbi:DUF4190 domain-containing protein [Streptomyces sp. NPDC050504]|uniref:DUF4190 domain-containing protein n=1 Tax=Streptomyces sp. NPDC050504 TaxID=3365618 RepID=UPI0037927D2E